jgi:hypothetical protein
VVVNSHLKALQQRDLNLFLARRTFQMSNLQMSNLLLLLFERVIPSERLGTAGGQRPRDNLKFKLGTIALFAYGRGLILFV